MPEEEWPFGSSEEKTTDAHEQTSAFSCIDNTTIGVTILEDGNTSEQLSPIKLINEAESESNLLIKEDEQPTSVEYDSEKNDDNPIENSVSVDTLPAVENTETAATTFGARETIISSDNSEGEVKETEEDNRVNGSQQMTRNSVGSEKHHQENLNDSMVSTGSTREEEILKTQEVLGQSSQAFMDHLRGAAFRRKLDLTRSRDSLMAKEKQQRETIAASRAMKQSQIDGSLTNLRGEGTASSKGQAEADTTAVSSFKARSVPTFVGIEGVGGLSGVPKVEKKPTTTPFSPLLGARRYLRKLAARKEKSPPKTEDENGGDGLFRALPLPSSTSALNTGYSGVPKVPKRKTTIPFSPLLGSRRPKAAAPLAVRTNMATDDSQSSAYSSQSPVVGVEYLSGEGGGPEATTASSVHSNDVESAAVDLAYIPASTVRAQKRANYEEHRKHYQVERLERESSERKGEIRKLNHELRELRPSL